MAKLLIVTTAFAPKNVIGSIRPSKLAKYLTRLGHEVAVISPSLPPDAPRDLLLMSPEIERLERLEVPYARLHDRLGSKYRRDTKAAGAGTSAASTGWKGMAIGMYKHAQEWLWSRRARQTLKQLAGPEGFDAVISTYPNYGPHWLAAWARRKGLARRWVADFRDPMVYEWLGPVLGFVNKRLQRQAERRADALTTVSRDAMEKFPVASREGKLHWLPNGFDPEDLKGLRALEKGSAEPGAPLVFSYAGGLYGGQRDLSAFFSALRQLVDDGFISESDIRLDYAGLDGAVLRKYARDASLEAIAADHGQLVRQQALALQQNADCALIATHNTRTDRGILTGKVYECLMIGNPILALVAGDVPGSELGGLIRRVKAGVVYEEAAHEQDFPSMKDFILQLLHQKRETGKVAWPMDEAQKNAYSYREIAGGFQALAAGEAVP